MRRAGRNCGGYYRPRDRNTPMRNALDYLVPACFLATGLALSGRIAWLQRGAAPVEPMLRILRLFALGAGVFLLVLLIMCGG